MARRGNIGGTARAVAKGWKKFQELNPGMSPWDIAETYVRFRYQITHEPHLAEAVINSLPYGVNPLILAWAILKVENSDEPETLTNHMEAWKQIMREEIQKLGLTPE